MSIYNEGDSFSIRVKLFDEDGAAVVPDTARYKIEDLTSGRNIRAYTDLAVAAEMDVSITSSDNVILSERSRLERRQLVIQTNHGEDDQRVGTYEWDVRNLQGS